MAITTTRAHVSRALDFFNKNSIYFAIGKKTPWDDDTDTPPAPSVDASELQELIGFKKVESIHLVVPDDINGTISYRQSKWTVVSPDEAIEKGAKWVYLETTLRYDELPLGHYRQVGLFTGLVPFVGKKEVLRAAISGTVTQEGNIVFNLGTSPLQIAVTTSDTIETIKQKVLQAGVNGWTITSGEGAGEIIFTCNTVGVQEESTFQNGSTGIIGSIDVSVKGEDPVSSKFNLLPEEVSDQGVLEIIDNRGDSNRLEDQTEQLSIVIEF